jgi:hypothetical protein
MFNDDELIYFGSCRVALTHVQGTVTAFVASRWCEALDRDRVAPRVAADTDVVVPTMPVVDVVAAECGDADADVLSDAAVPSFLRQPVIKVALESAPADSPLCVASGARSALVMLGTNHWYRIKGCGNFTDGFTVRVNATSVNKRPWRDIRGSAFRHTALRELFMTANLQAHMEAAGCVSVNTPVALSEYSGAAQLPLGAAVATASVIERTLGDRRFGTHVLAGLEVLLPLLCDVPDAAQLLACFPPLRPGRESLDTLVTSAELAMDQMLGGLEWPTLKRDASLFANMTRHAAVLTERAPLDGRPRPMQWTRDGAKPMGDVWCGIWDATVEQLSIALRECRGVLAYLYNRCGYDAGCILRTMHAQRISWGTYQDQMCNVEFDEWHCNAHANNLVLLPPDGQTRFLGFLDLDMAFSERAALGFSPGEFDRLLEREFLNLMQVLTGTDPSNGVPSLVVQQCTSLQSPLTKAAKSALYDTLLLGFLGGYHGTTSDVCAFDAKLHSAANLVLKLAVTVMADFIA